MNNQHLKQKKFQNNKQKIKRGDFIHLFFIYNINCMDSKYDFML